MRALSRAIASGVPFRLDRMRIIEPLRLRDWGVLEQHVLSLRSRAFEFALRCRAEFGADVKSVLGPRVREQSSAPIEEIHQFCDTADGMALTLWLCLRERDSYEWCRDVIANMAEGTRREFIAVRDRASGVDLLASFDWMPILDESTENMSWSSLTRAVGEVVAPGMSPEQIGNMTLYQLRAWLCEPKELKGKRTVPLSRAKEYQQKSREQQQRSLF